jgi:hypothetical protein
MFAWPAWQTAQQVNKRGFALSDESGKLKGIKQQLAVLARRKKSRDWNWNPDCPTEWQPTQVIDPRSSNPFTHDGAWDFIAERLEQENTVIEEVILDNPPKKKAYVLRESTAHGEIYIKIHFGNGGKIKGRSFHY